MAKKEDKKKEVETDISNLLLTLNIYSGKLKGWAKIQNQ